ncbi:phosphatidylinositol mannoside acyltransferase [Pseudonocardia kunmingensis]|uniref:KDO2-lipid IV(A) lauroyltransferase n=1 Tax=Pseudonocardia kunmingensis TaxID=630975 RepID=A0A543D4C6_9PSEU|nr:phosphatidylinositol mannoside acyltransferase [Pseudonocardia kunmingensis]TQM04172.1 KDO2-lipid IV(A) lauroyltransferase [Pseudonocardia kunmingensis]
MTAARADRVPVAERLADAQYAAAWRLVRALPAGAAAGVFRLAADLAARTGAGPAVRLRANLGRVVPAATPAELDRLVRAGLRSYARYWCEMFRLRPGDAQAVHARMDEGISGTGPFFDAIAAGRGVVFAVPHSGNWDAAGVWVVETLRGLGHEPVFTTMAQRLRPESLFRRFLAYREALGFEVVAAEAGTAAHRALTRRLRAGGVVCLVADRDLAGSGVEVSFFGEPARFPAGPARLAALTGAVLMPAYPHFSRDGWVVPIADPVPVERSPDSVAKATQAIADAFARLIAQAPEDWHALQPLWTADREPG